MTDILIKNGTVVTSTNEIQADLALDEGKIVWIGKDFTSHQPKRIIDAEGLFVLPGRYSSLY